MHKYRFLTTCVAPLIPLWLRYRAKRGKEEKHRLKERYGIASQKRPEGTLLWIHAASVGEANSVIPFLEKTLRRFPDIQLLLTTGTVTSAHLMHQRLPAQIIHQYVPIDTPEAVNRFVKHWQPDIALWVESELWPNLITAADDYGAYMGIINARMSERSFRSWQKHPHMIKQLLNCFQIIFAQSPDDAMRLQSLGARYVHVPGNLKYDGAFLTCNEDELLTLQEKIGARPVWVAASTHPGEEAIMAQIHRSLATAYPELLTIIIPRHPGRGSEIAASLDSSLNIALRSRNDPLSANTNIYIADTLGELGLFYRLSEIVCMGGSLVKHGGQNPLEAARLSCAIITGPHTHNFSDIYNEMEHVGACLRVQNPEQLSECILQLIQNCKAREALQSAASHWVKSKGGAADRILDTLAPALEIKNNQPTTRPRAKKAKKERSA